jgi:hypothetical protein
MTERGLHRETAFMYESRTQPLWRGFFFGGSEWFHVGNGQQHAMTRMGRFADGDSGAPLGLGGSEAGLTTSHDPHRLGRGEQKEGERRGTSPSASIPEGLHSEGADYFLGGSNLRWNPLYEVTRQEWRIHLKRRFPAESIEGVLPEEVFTDVDDRSPELIRKLVLIDLPPGYAEPSGDRSSG